MKVTFRAPRSMFDPVNVTITLDETAVLGSAMDIVADLTKLKEELG